MARKRPVRAAIKTPVRIRFIEMPSTRPPPLLRAAAGGYVGIAFPLEKIGFPMADGTGDKKAEAAVRPALPPPAPPARAEAQERRKAARQAGEAARPKPKEGKRPKS